MNNLKGPPDPRHETCGECLTRFLTSTGVAGDKVIAREGVQTDYRIAAWLDYLYPKIIVDPAVG